MKPSFALDLRFSVITLLHRTARGWLKIGEIALEDPELSGALGRMRAKALGLSPSGITTKVILPNSEILYTAIQSPVAGDDARRRRIESALDGLTPYQLDDLVFDWCEAGSGLQIAALAKETLEEAENFAKDHHFNPVSFVAVPEPGTFSGEPFFGVSKSSKTVLAFGETVERDREPVWSIAQDVPDAKLPVTQPPVTQPPTASPVAAEKAIVPGPAEIAAVVPKPTDKEQPVPEAAKPLPFVNTPLPHTQVAPNVSVLPPQGAAPAHSAPVKTETLTAPRATPVQASALPASKTMLDAPEAPMLVDVEPDTAYRRAPPQDIRRPVPQAQLGPPAVPAAVAVAQSTRPTALSDDEAPLPAPFAREAVPRPAAAKPSPMTPAVPRPKAARPWQAAPAPSAAARARGGANIAKTRAAPNRAAAKKGTATARQRRSIIVILSAVLVLLLAMMVIWAALSLSTKDAKNLASSPPPLVAQSAGPSAKPVPVASPPASSPAAQATADTASGEKPDFAAKPPEKVQTAEAAKPDTPKTTAQEPAVTQTASADLGPKPIIGLQDVVAPQTDLAGHDEIFLASADTPPINLDPIALPDLEVGAHTPPALPQDPPPKFVVAASDTPPTVQTKTPEDADASQGVLVIAGRPPYVPPVRPQIQSVTSPLDLTKAPPVEIAMPAADLPAGESAWAQDPTLADKRPHGRPTNLASATPEPGAADPLAPDSRYAKLRPRPRPADVVPVVANAQASSLLLTSAIKPVPRPTQGDNATATIASSQAPTPDAPKTETSAPSLPTNASVAKQATEVNVLNANRIALLAVFGTSTNRYAMIRLVSGRVAKVKVGDVIDSGRIAGITADSVQYQKGSRIVTLSLP